MSFRKLFCLLILFSLMMSLLIVGCTIPTSNDGVRTELITVEVIITATPDPAVTPEVIIITATLDRTQVAVPDGIVPESTGSNSNTAQSGVTQIPDSDIEAVSSDSNVPGGCLIHVVDEGDTVFGIAEEYEVNPFIMLEVNGLTEDTAFLNIGDELLVPIEGCPIEEIVPPTPVIFDTTADAEETPEVTAEVTDEATEEVNLTPSPTPTVTLAPTAVDSEIEIVEVVRAGDVTAEGVRIRNNGRLVDLEGWTLSDADGNDYQFSEFLLFSNAEHTIYSRASENTPIASFWGLEEAVWQPGDVVTLSDADGDVQAVLRIPVDVDAP